MTVFKRLTLSNIRNRMQTTEFKNINKVYKANATGGSSISRKKQSDYAGGGGVRV
jgi:hypothetical protein